MFEGGPQWWCKLPDRWRHWDILGEWWHAGTALDPSAHEERHCGQVRTTDLLVTLIIMDFVHNALISDLVIKFEALRLTDCQFVKTVLSIFSVSTVHCMKSDLIFQTGVHSKKSDFYWIQTINIIFDLFLFVYLFVLLSRIQKRKPIWVRIKTLNIKT